MRFSSASSGASSRGAGTRPMAGSPDAIMRSMAITPSGERAKAWYTSSGRLALPQADTWRAVSDQRASPP